MMRSLPLAWARQIIRQSGASEQLLEAGFAIVPARQITRHFPQVREGMRQLLTKSPSTQERWKARRRDTFRHGEPDTGLFPKHKGGKKRRVHAYQKKEGRFTEDTAKRVLHVNPALSAILRRQGIDTNAPYARKLLRATLEVNARSFALAYACAEEFDRKIPGSNFAKRVWRMWREGIMVKTRVLFYAPGVNIRAQVHRDESFITVHAQSDENGLGMWDRNGNPVELDETDPNSVIIFFGIKSSPASQWRLRGLFHGVSQRTNARYRARVSLVTFVHLHLSSFSWMHDSRLDGARERASYQEMLEAA